MKVGREARSLRCTVLVIAHAAAWAGVCPGNNESAGKRMPQQKRRGNVHFASMLVQAAFGIENKGQLLEDFSVESLPRPCSLG